jgi:hypothetical protein
MAALTQDINTPEREGTFVVLPVAAGATIYGGALACVNAQGYAVPGATATGLKAIGRAEAGAVGPEPVKAKRGVFQFANSAGDDEIKTKNIGDACYIVDDATVALTAGLVDEAATRSAAGVVFDVDADGVWVRI